MRRYISPLLVFISTILSYSQVGIGTTNPSGALDVEVSTASDGIQINNTSVNGDPTLQFQTQGNSIVTMGVDASDGNKFKIASSQITSNNTLTIDINRNIGIRTTTPTNMLNMTNGGSSVSGSMAYFQNFSFTGIAFSAQNHSTANASNVIEGITDYNGTAFSPAGVYGLGQYSGVASVKVVGVSGMSNDWQGTGIKGSRSDSGGPDLGFGAEVYNDLGYTGSLLTLSDQRTKTHVAAISGALDIVSRLKPVTYRFDTRRFPYMGMSSESEFGFIAQEVKKVLPEITKEKMMSTNATKQVVPGEPQVNNSEIFLTMDYTRLIPILTKAIQEQQQQIEELKREVHALKKAKKR